MPNKSYTMEWDRLLSARRTGQEDKQGLSNPDRTQFQRDYDRLVFSSPFRRLQDKTQVFPLPGSVFVHNRLTHSLEVSCVGRSLGNNLSRYLLQSQAVQTDLVHEIGSVVAAACLAHDLGNPPFGHSGEAAISNYFANGSGLKYKGDVSPAELNDLVNFEGNANAIRVLTHQFNGRRKGGFALTYTTLASIVKYPFECQGKTKYGFFQTERDTYQTIANHLGIVKDDNGKYARHPLVLLVEAADDICYLFMDIEDAHKLGILTTQEAQGLFLAFFDGADVAQQHRINDVMADVTDANEQLAFLRALVIGKLVNVVGKIFIDNELSILEGTFTGSLVGRLTGTLGDALKHCRDISVARIYRHPKVAEIEIAGFKILGCLLDEFVSAVLEPQKPYARLLLPFIPQQYATADDATVYDKIMGVVDFVSGMTDVYALDLYRKLNGMGLKDKSL